MIIAALVLTLLSAGLPASTAPEPQAELALALERSGARRAEWTAALAQAPAEQREGLAFLVSYMPARDLRELSVEFVLENVRLAYEVRAQVPWGADLPESVFRNAVLPYASVSEKRDAWRPQFIERFLPLIAACKTPGEAAQLLNRRIFPELGVRYSTQRRAADQGPFETIESGLASCTGLSILLTDACRAVGVPARLAGIPSWVNKTGNHTWVEVWDGEWHFTGAAEPSDQGLDHAWFVGDARLAIPGSEEHAIYALMWESTGTLFPMVFAEGAPRVNAVDVSARYVGEALGEALGEDLCRLMIEVRAGGTRAAHLVRVTALGKPARAFEGTSRDERADTNDYLTLVVPRGRSYRVTVPETGMEPRLVAVGAGSEQLLIRLE